jgi:hypothetical protein
MTGPLGGFEEFLGEVTCSSEEVDKMHVVASKKSLIILGCQLTFNAKRRLLAIRGLH